MRFKFCAFPFGKSKSTATFPYRGKRGGGATEDRISNRPGLDHLAYDFGLRGLPHVRDSARIWGCLQGVNSLGPCQGARKGHGAEWRLPPRTLRLHIRGDLITQQGKRPKMQAIGLCRFSYPALGGFQVAHENIKDRIAYLYKDSRLEERFQLLETVALPCLRAQTDPDFSLIIVIGDQFPKHHEKRLEALIEDLPQALIHKEPPRNQREVMKEILNAARINPSEPCLQFRYDDDDAISVDFIEKFRKATSDCASLIGKNRTVAFDWNRGFVAEFGADAIAAVDMFRQFYVASLGMYIKGNCSQTIMNFAHEKIPRYMPTVSFSDDAMWVRSHNGFNDSRQKKVKPIPVQPLTPKLEKLFKDRFAIDVAQVRRVFSDG